MAILAAVITPCSGGQPSEHVLTVHLRSGRTFQGQIDPRTSVDQLWLRATRPGISIVRPIAWDRVDWAEQEGQRFDVDQLRQLASRGARQSTSTADDAPDQAAAGFDQPQREELPPPPPRPAAPDVPPAQPESFLVDDRPTAMVKRPGPAPPWFEPLPFPPSVKSLAIDAYLGHWQAGVEPTGIVVHVFPLDASGAVTLADGTLVVELIAQRPTNYRDGRSFERIGRWTCRLSPQAMGPAGAVFRLPFQAVHPEFDLEVGRFGLVVATLSAPGQGTFSASQSTVRIRPASRFRDQIQQATGTRYLAIEPLGRTR